MNLHDLQTASTGPGYQEERLLFQVGEVEAGSVLSWFLSGVKAELIKAGFQLAFPSLADAAEEQVRLVLHPFAANAPRIFRRRSQSVYVVGVTDVQAPPHAEHPLMERDILKEAYPLLIRSLSNLLIYIVRSAEESTHDAPSSRSAFDETSPLQVYFVTLERGHYPVRSDAGSQVLFEEVVDRLMPLATSRLVIDNLFEEDLPPELHHGDEFTEAICRAGRRLDELNLLPTPFPIHELLDEKDLRHIHRLFRIGGLSYGNVSTRRDRNSFWMSASGIDKANMSLVGRDIQLVKGYDPSLNAMRLSVPPGMPPRRVSVDAIEHWLIYREHPDVGAILHVHAWMEGIPSTDVNYPCGTIQLAQAVADQVRAAEQPGKAIVGLRNHGLTITGPSLDEIFERIDGRILPQVPMT